MTASDVVRNPSPRGDGAAELEEESQSVGMALPGDTGESIVLRKVPSSLVTVGEGASFGGGKGRLVVVSTEGVRRRDDIP